ncbi:VOC family protein [Rossellomorea sp. AcN35-11]|nr:VOC family protein [Rossellomorea aquimaris]WJV29153.1 VOC family protein [Rossellomorea sp. AcN35-11]
MKQLVRVGTIYIPVGNVQKATEWYQKILNGEVNYQDEDKAILNLANMSIFLVGSSEGESSNFQDRFNKKRFSLTFEVDGLGELEELREDLLMKGVQAGEIEDRGHRGRNFIFPDRDGNLFDVWSELSPQYKKAYNL